MSSRPTIEKILADIAVGKRPRRDGLVLAVRTVARNLRGQRMFRPAEVIDQAIDELLNEGLTHIENAPTIFEKSSHLAELLTQAEAELGDLRTALAEAHQFLAETEVKMRSLKDRNDGLQAENEALAAERDQAKIDLQRVLNERRVAETGIPTRDAESVPAAAVPTTDAPYEPENPLDRMPGRDKQPVFVPAAQTTLKKTPPTIDDRLSAIELKAEGFSNAEIGERLGLRANQVHGLTLHDKRAIERLKAAAPHDKDRVRHSIRAELTGAKVA